jgi:A/G-specific adenine glycosylase
MTPAQKLLAWYKKEGRDLPWRHTREAYSILVSEVMLQQTQVSRVIEYYHQWLKKFPSWEALAAAKTDEVIRAWSGLGYNRRGLMLRSIAQHVVQHGEPKSEAEWLLLKGIGPYTAAALAAFSLQQRTLPIDTNIRRVLGRVFLGLPFPQLTDDEHIRAATKNFLPARGRHFDIPQALFDLATSICTKSPQCAICPLRKDCKSAPLFLAGGVEVPKRTIKQANEKKHLEKPYPDRIYRGRILKAVKESAKKLNFDAIAFCIDPSFRPELDTKWVEAMLERLTHEGFLEQTNGRWGLKKE